MKLCKNLVVRYTNTIRLYLSTLPPSVSIFASIALAVNLNREFESLVLDGPIFKKRVVIQESEIKEEDENTARLVVKKAELAEK